MSVLVCSSQYGGCGYVGVGKDWKTLDVTEDDCYFLCPKCGEDHAIQVTDENISRLFAGDEDGLSRAQQLIDRE